jgi:hypothetical protein
VIDTAASIPGRGAGHRAAFSGDGFVGFGFVAESAEELDVPACAVTATGDDPRLGHGGSHGHPDPQAVRFAPEGELGESGVPIVTVTSGFRRGSE